MPQDHTRESLGHSVLSRYLPTVSRIITTASFCHVYRGAFDTDSNGTFSWEKKDISGSLFLVATANPTYEGEEEYHLVILNRQSMNNFIWTLSSPECIEDDGEHLVFSNTSGFSPMPIPEPGYAIDKFSCWGIWVFPNPSVHDERTKLLQAVMDCARRAEGYANARQQKARQPQQQQQQQQQQPLQMPPTPQLQQSLGNGNGNGNGDGGGAPLAGYSIMDQVFPQAAVRQPSPSQYAPPPPQFPPYPTPQMQHQPMPPQNGGGGGGDILGRLFESARQRSTPQPEEQRGY